MLQVRHSLRSVRRPVAEPSCHLLFLWFLGPTIGATAWNHPISSKDRSSLSEKDAIS
jgi:hypothetical protein